MENITLSIIEQIKNYYQITGIQLTIGAVESATGGRISDKITNISGSSVFFKGSIVAYNNEIKIKIAGVKKETLELNGAVSSEVALEMAQGGKQVLDVDICISDTGIAGPTGNTLGKPIGLFYLGLAAHNTQLTEKHLFLHNREKNKHQAVEATLLLLKQYLEKRLVKVHTGSFKEHHVVTSFLRNNDKILILKRSQKVSTYKGLWSGISGYIGKDALIQAITEIKEETGLQEHDVTLIKKGNPLSIIDETLNSKWNIHPFLFNVVSPEKVVIDWENVEYKWVTSAELLNYKTVPGLMDTLNKVL